MEVSSLEIGNLTGILGMVWPFLILIGIFYFFMYRPQKKMQLERGRFLMSLKKGDKVVTSGGMHGIIKVLRDSYVELEIAPKVIVRVDKAAIHHGNVKLMDAEEAKKAGAAMVGAKAMKEPEAKKAEEKPADTEIVEEVIEVDDPSEEGTEVVEEVVEVDDNDENVSATEEKK